MKNPTSLSIVIPCFNEEDVLPELRRRLTLACEELHGMDIEFVLIDDGSSDRTRQILREFHVEDPRFTIVLLSRNYGHQLALSAGLQAARGERICVIDADLQDPPELIGPMLSRMDEGYDVVYGRRRSRKAETAFKKGTAALFYRLLDRMVDIRIPRDTGDFRLMSRRVVDVLNGMPENNRFIRGMISWIGFPQTAFDYDRDERFAGETKYPLRRMVRFALDAITGFSTVPLKLATWLGFVFASISALLLVYVLASWFRGATVAGWTSLGVIVLLLGGVQLIMIGVMGEYIGRLYLQSKARPLFVVEQTLRAERNLAAPVATSHVGG